jgi:ubiquinone/menaquinone biosynthesis C-methylase UbiE
LGEIENLKPRYDEVYSTLDYGPLETARGFLGAMDMLPRLRGEQKVLCVGSGNSYEAVLFSLNDKDTYTLDYYHPKVKKLAGKQVCGQGQAIPFKDETFDLVFSAECLEHIPENEVDQFLSELYRVGSKEYYFTIAERDDPPYHTHICLHSIEWWMDKLELLKYKVINATWRPCVRNVNIINGQVIVWDAMALHGFVFYAKKS